MKTTPIKFERLGKILLVLSLLFTPYSANGQRRPTSYKMEVKTTAGIEKVTYEAFRIPGMGWLMNGLLVEKPDGITQFAYLDNNTDLKIEVFKIIKRERRGGRIVKSEKEYRIGDPENKKIIERAQKQFDYYMKLIREDKAKKVFAN